MPQRNPPCPLAFREQLLMFIKLLKLGRSAKELSTEFGCCVETIKNYWEKREGNKPICSSPSKSMLITVAREELSRLRREVRQLKVERDILSIK